MLRKNLSKGFIDIRKLQKYLDRDGISSEVFRYSDKYTISSNDLDKKNEQQKLGLTN